MNMNKLAMVIHDQNKEMGWWDDPERCIFEVLQLVVTEIAEATEGERKDLMDDHLTHRKMGEVELADALIRLLDVAGRYNWSYLSSVMYHPLLVLDTSIGRQHFACTMAVCDLGEVITARGEKHADHNYSIAVKTIMYVSALNNYNIMAALNEKLDYNRDRADHKREARAAEGGKKF